MRLILKILWYFFHSVAGLTEVHNGAPDRSRHTSSQVSARNQRELEKLRKQTERYKEIIEQQEEFIHVMQVEYIP